MIDALIGNIQRGESLATIVLDDYCEEHGLIFRQWKGNKFSISTTSSIRIFGMKFDKTFFLGDYCLFVKRGLAKAPLSSITRDRIVLNGANGKGYSFSHTHFIRSNKG